MNLLQHSWSDMLLLDHLHQRMHNNLADEMLLPNGQRFDLLTLALLGVTAASDQLHQLTIKLAELKFDTIDYTCLKFLLLLNPDAGGLNNYELVSDAFNQIQRTLLEFCLNFHSQVPVSIISLLLLTDISKSLLLTKLISSRFFKQTNDYRISSIDLWAFCRISEPLQSEAKISFISSIGLAWRLLRLYLWKCYMLKEELETYVFFDYL